jgi:TM2 domain-containing membrane protein YozV
MAMPAQVQYVTLAKSRGTYIVLGLLLGALGIHNFYIGRNGVAVAQLVITLLSPCLVFVPLIAVYIWVIAELIAIKRDGKGHLLA